YCRFEQHSYRSVGYRRQQSCWRGAVTGRGGTTFPRCSARQRRCVVCHYRWGKVIPDWEKIVRAVIQRVSQASCEVDGRIVGSIGQGFLVLLGIEGGDGPEDLSWLAQKIANLRVFGDENGLMNKSLADVNGNILLISQFTLFAHTKKGNRPSFIRAAKPEKALALYQDMIAELSAQLGREVATGVFGADMKVSLTNDGPVTIVMDTKDKDNH